MVVLLLMLIIRLLLLLVLVLLTLVRLLPLLLMIYVKLLRFKRGLSVIPVQALVISSRYLPILALNLLILDYNALSFLVVYRDWETDRKSTRLNSSHSAKSRMPSSA